MNLAERRIAAVAIAASIGLCLAGCAPSVPPNRAELGVVSEPLDHIHGLGVNGVSGERFVATHDGLFSLPRAGGTPQPMEDLPGPIGGLAQDTMGFTGFGNDLYGSGHPDPMITTDLSSANLGLVVSTDSGETWDDLALHGEVDFHDLDVSSNATGALTVVGYEEATGTVWVSNDTGATWTKGATVTLRDLAVDPTTPATIYSTTAEGLLASTDDARSFSPVIGAPSLYLIDSLEAEGGGSLIGVDIDGQIWLTVDGFDWRATGSISGTAEALTYATAPIPTLLIADDRGVVESSDFGATWTIVAPK